MTRWDAPVTPLPRVLLVDDDDLYREPLRANLIDAGFAVEEVASGPAALDLLGKGDAFALVILDWRMPGMNGIEVLRRMREDGLTVPVIVLTELVSQIYEEAALQGGAVDFVEKSRSFSILLRRITLIIEGAKGGGGGERRGRRLVGRGSASRRASYGGGVPPWGSRAASGLQPRVLGRQPGTADGHRVPDG